MEEYSRLTGEKVDDLKEKFFDIVEGEEPKLKDGVTPGKDLAKGVAAKMKTDRENQYGRGKSEVWTKVEQALEGSGYAGESMGLDALTEHLANTKPDPDKKGKPAEITPEALEKSPVARQWLDKKIKPLKDQEAELKQQIKDVETTAKRDRITAKGKDKMIAHLDSKKWDDGGDELRAKRIRALSNLIDWSRISEDDKGNLIVLDNNGQPALDDLSNPVSFESLVEDANAFGYKKYDKKDGSPPPKGKGDQGDSDLVITSVEQAQKLEKEAYLIKDQAKKIERIQEVSAAKKKFLAEQKAR